MKVKIGKGVTKMLTDINVEMLDRCAAMHKIPK